MSKEAFSQNRHNFDSKEGVPLCRKRDSVRIDIILAAKKAYFYVSINHSAGIDIMLYQKRLVCSKRPALAGGNYLTRADSCKARPVG